MTTDTKRADKARKLLIAARKHLDAGNFDIAWARARGVVKIIAEIEAEVEAGIRAENSAYFAAMRAAQGDSE